MILERHQLETYNPETRDFKDRRRIVARAVFSYLDENGNEYRKSFTAQPNTPETEFWNIAPKSITQ